MKFFVTIVLIFSSLFGSAQISTQQLQEKIADIFQKNQRDFAIPFKNISKEDDSILIQAKEDFHAGSTMKTPVMAEVFKQASEGKLRISLIVKKYEDMDAGTKMLAEVPKLVYNHINAN